MIQHIKILPHVLAVFFLLSSVACRKYRESMLVGKWQAIEVFENGERMPLDIRYINFEFKNDDSYVFNSTLRYREEGYYYIKDSLLYTKDELNNTPEKAVQIAFYNGDTLHLNMETESSLQLMKLYRVKK